MKFVCMSRGPSRAAGHALDEGKQARIELQRRTFVGGIKMPRDCERQHHCWLSTPMAAVISCACLEDCPGLRDTLEMKESGEELSKNDIPLWGS
jgi:hypothetical protein